MRNRTGSDKSTIPKVVGHVSLSITRDNGVYKTKFIRVKSGKKMLHTCIDSGANITVLRSNDLRFDIAGQGIGQIKLSGAFDHETSQPCVAPR